MKRLPIARTVFKHLIEENLCYVDKTLYIKQLNDSVEKYWFLSRPPRFGKSLFIDTLRAAFAGEKELFKDLFLENNWDWTKKYPVITISFVGGNISNKADFQISAGYSVECIASDYKIKLIEKTAETKFKELIIKLYEKYKLGVVVLIDEYDKPLLDNITEDIVYDIRKELAGFYSVLKGAEKYLKFVFITGVSKFSKTSIFSKLNNLIDISLDKQYADICGYTQNDLQTVFKDYLINVDLKKVKEWYDGYNFLGENLYNPYDILLFFKNKKYKPYWFETGTPTFLLDIIKERKFYVPKLENIRIADYQMNEFELNKIELLVLLFQTGYLTIKNETEIGIYTYYDLQFPNKEVRVGFNEYILRMFYTEGINVAERSDIFQKIYFAITDDKPQDLEKTFKTFFAYIPHDWYRKNDIAKFEGFYSSMFYSFFAALGFDIIAEDTTNKGRIDLTVITETSIFIFEFKMKNNKKNALAQIKEKKYHEKYTNQNKNIYLIGIEFDEQQKNTSKFEYEKI